MNKLLHYMTCAAFCLLGLTSCSTEKQPRELHILYLGGQSEWTNGKYGETKKFTDAEFEAYLAKRANDFGTLLHAYFDSVTVMKAADYRPEMSDNYDVTIFDGLPPALEEQLIERDENGNVTNYVKARYLPDNFSAACITIGSLGESLGSRLGIKNDWYCLCLDANAHGMNLEHPIFNGPFKTNITLVKEPTPEDAFHYQYFQEEKLPDSVMMWQVNTKGYTTDDGYAAGMVARPWGYTDSPDCEVMSSGVCAKTIDAVAIGRHGNFLHWGFIGGPEYMTDEAKTVFANTVVYMAGHKGQPIARKYLDRRACRDYIREMKHYSQYSTYVEQERNDSVYYIEMKATYETAKAKQAKGETLNPREASALEYGEVRIPPKKTFTEFLKRYTRGISGLYEQLGEDESKYLQYYKENLPYFYSLPEMYQMVVDEDAKAWQIPNNDIRLIEKAVECLEQGLEVERAYRILERYTLCEFTQPSEWRTWLNKYRDKIFFTESGGWFFMVNEQDAPGNDYKALERREAAKAKVEQKVAESSILEPDAQNPVIVQARAKKINAGTASIEINIRIMAGYHIYQVVGDGDPYLPLKLEFPLPEGCSLEGSAQMPVAKPFGSKGTKIYEDDLTITQQVKCDEMPASLTCKVSFQCCDAHVCLPPVENEFTLEVH